MNAAEPHPFDVFFDEHGYQDGDEPQAFADWLASLTDEKIVGIATDFSGAVESKSTKRDGYSVGGV